MDHRTSTILDDLYLCRQVRFILIATIVSLPVASFGQEADIHPSLQAILEEHEKTVIAIQRLCLALQQWKVGRGRTPSSLSLEHDSQLRSVSLLV